MMMKGQLSSDAFMLCGVIFLECLVHIVIDNKSLLSLKGVLFVLLILYKFYQLNHKLSYCPSADVEVTIEKNFKLYFFSKNIPCISCDIALA